MAHVARCTLSIPNGQTKSGSVQTQGWDTPNAGKVAMDNAANIQIKAPAALTGVVTVQTAQTNPSVDADFANYQDSPGVDVTIAAGKTVRIGLPAAADLRLISSAAEGAQRDFIVSIQEDMAG